MTVNAHHIRVYYEDTDSGGVVYYANYLKFAERARTEALRNVGIDQSVLLREEKVAFVVRKCTVDFLKPAMLDDHLTIHTQLHDISRVSVQLEQTIMRGQETLVTLSVKLAVIGANQKPVRLSEALLTRLTHAFNPAS